MSKTAAATLDLGQGTSALRLGSSTRARRASRSRIAAAWSHQRDIARQRADLSKSHDAGLGRDTGCRV